jgi:hypothetical protein
MVVNIDRPGSSGLPSYDDCARDRHGKEKPQQLSRHGYIMIAVRKSDRQAQTPRGARLNFCRTPRGGSSSNL